MAAVAGFLYCEDPLRRGYGSITSRWDEEDTRIRLSLIARTWVQMRSVRKPEAAYPVELVWKMMIL